MAITSKFVFNPFTGNFDSTIDANLSYAQVKYVDKANTFTYTADGSIDKPYKSIEAMYNAITDASASKRYAVVIAPGTYTEAATIRIKGWIDLISFATDTVIIAVAGGATLKWSNNNPGRVFIKDMGFTSGFEILNDNPTGTSGIVFDLDNVDAPSIIFNGRGGGRDFIQLRNDTRISGSCTIRSAATTIFDSTNISNLIMSDVGCVAPDAFGSAITASLRSNYIGAIQITATTFDVYTDIWGTIVAGNLSITSNSPSFPCYFNHDATSYPLGTITLTGSNPAQVVATSVAQAIRYTPATPANWPTVPDDVKEGLDLLSASIVGNQQLTKEPTGFASRTTSTISFDELNREFTIAPTGASFEVYVKGAKFTKTSESITIPNNSGDHYIYYSSTGVLSSTMVINESLFADNALVAIVYWNADTSKQSYFGEERHGLVMDGATHGYLHTVFGARYISGCALQGFTIGAGSVDADAQFSADSGSIRDEDILHQFFSQAQLPVLYRSGANWRKKPADAFPFIQSGVEGYVGASGRIAFNEFTGGAWQLTEVPNNHFTMVHLFATNDINTPYVAIIGTNTYATKPDAQDSANSEIASLTGIPFAEFVAIGTVILQSADSFTNSVKAAVQVTGDGANYVDFRGAQIFAPSGQASNHSLLSNLDKDDHIQYHNDARGDARYYTKAQTDTAIGLVGLANVGSGEGVYKDKVGSTSNLKSLKAGTNITLTSGTDDITISSTDTGEVNTASNVGSGSGVFKQKSGVDLQFKSLIAGSNITLTPSDNEITISSSGGGGGSSVEILNTSSTSLDLVSSPIVNVGNTNKELYLKSDTVSDQGQIYKNNPWNSVVYGNGVYVALSDHPTGDINNKSFIVSTDGETWQPVSTPLDGYVVNWKDITYGNGLFVALARDIVFVVEYYTFIMTSPDGVNWTVRETPYDYEGMIQSTWTSITYGNGLFVAVSDTYDSWQVVYSSDGITWTPINTFSAGWSSVTYGNGLFVAVAGTLGTQKIMTSPDAITWTMRTHPQAVLEDIVYADGKFVAVGNSTASFPTVPNVLTSIDGINWTAQTPASPDINSIAYGNGVYVAINDSSIFYQYSPDAVTWTQGTLPTYFIIGKGICFGGGKFVAVGGNYHGSILNSDDGVNWTTHNEYKSVFKPFKDLIPDNTFLGYYVKSIAYGENVWVAALTPNQSPNDIHMHYSLDNGKTWVKSSTFINSAVSSVTYGNGVFVAVSYSSPSASVLRSLDGITWTAYAPSSNGWTGVTFGNNLFVAVANSGTNRVMTSPDGITWTLRNASLASSWKAVTWGNNLFVAVSTSGTGNRVMTSPDGITWTTRTSAADSIWNSIAFGNGTFVAVANSGTGNRVMYSTNGTTWTGTAGNSKSFTSITFGNGFFYKVVSGLGFGIEPGYLSTSTDGITWTKRNAIFHVSQGIIAYGNGNYVAGAFNEWQYPMFSSAVQMPDGNIEGQTYELISTQESADQYFVPKVIMPPTDGSLDNTFVSLFKNKRLELRWDSDAQKWY